MLKKAQVPFICITVALFIGLILPSLIQDGMFMDGMIYATVAKNLAIGHGTYWDMHMSDYLLNHYRDQPPLTIWLTSFFFKIFGTSLYTERIYSFVTSVVCLFLITRIWRVISDKETRSMWWMPVLLWIVIPVCFWSYSNNMEENTMTIFILLSALFSIRAFQNGEKIILYGLLNGLSIVAAVMCKGVQGSFTLVMPLLYFIVFRRPELRKAITFYVMTAIVPFLFVLFVINYPPALKYLTEYFNVRVTMTFEDATRATTETRFYILFRLMMELSSNIVLAGILLLINNVKLKTHSLLNDSNKKYFVFFLLTGLAGTIPLLLTMEQRRFYLVCALPFYALANSYLLVKIVKYFIDKINTGSKAFKNILIASKFAIVMSIVVTVFMIGNTRRHNSMLKDIYKIGKLVPAEASIGASDEEFTNWSLHLYLQRYFEISMDCSDTKFMHDYLLISSTDTTAPPAGMKRMSVDLKDFILYANKNIDAAPN